MRFFGLYFAFFCFAFYYLFRGNPSASVLFGADMLFMYFVFTSSFVLVAVLSVVFAVKNGLRLAVVSPFFKGLFAGAAGIFIAKLLANRGALLIGSYILGEGFKNGDLYAGGIGVLFLALGYFVFRPFNFDFIGFRDSGSFENKRSHDQTTIDVEVLEDFDKLEKR